MFNINDVIKECFLKKYKKLNSELTFLINQYDNDIFKEEFFNSEIYNFHVRGEILKNCLGYTISQTIYNIEKNEKDKLEGCEDKIFNLISTFFNYYISDRNKIIKMNCPKSDLSDIERRIDKRFQNIKKLANMPIPGKKKFGNRVLTPNGMTTEDGWGFSGEPVIKRLYGKRRRRRSKVKR